VSRLAVADAHCHLWIEPPAGARGPRLADEPLAAAELREFRAAGGVLVLDCQPGGCGRDGAVLDRLERASGVRVLAATGYHLAGYYADGRRPWRDAEDARAAWTRELTEGLEEHPRVRARLVKAAWTGEEPDLLAAAAEAARAHDVPLVVHTERGARVEELAELLLDAGADPARVQLSHVDKRPDAGLHRELARAGFTLGYDSFLRPQYRPAETTWPLLLALAAEGLWRRITIGLDLVDPGLWAASGGPGLASIRRRLVPALRDAGLADEAVAGLAGGNAMRLAGLERRATA
jgi:phosphotriesterase-related protein